MSARVITSAIKRSDGSAWAGAVVDFRLERGAYTTSPAASYPLRTVRAVTDAAGALSVTLAGGLTEPWRVTLPDGETFLMEVPDGSPTTLEALRAAYEGA